MVLLFVYASGLKPDWRKILRGPGHSGGDATGDPRSVHRVEKYGATMGSGRFPRRSLLLSFSLCR